MSFVRADPRGPARALLHRPGRRRFATPPAIASGPLSFSFAFYPDRDGDLTLDEEPDKCLEGRGVQEFAGCPPSLRAAPTFSYDALPGRGVRLTALKILHMPQGGGEGGLPALRRLGGS